MTEVVHMTLRCLHLGFMQALTTEGVLRVGSHHDFVASSFVNLLCLGRVEID